MGGGDKETGRGWSLVFEDRTDQSPVVDAGRSAGESLESATIIDQDISDEIQEALRKRYEAATNEEDDELLENVPVPGVESLESGPEHTIRSSAPHFDETPLADVLRTDPPEAPGPKTTPEQPVLRPPDDDEEITNDGENGELEAPMEDLSAVELTRRAPIPFDLFAEQPLPDIERPAPKITRRKVTPRPPRRPRSEPKPAPEPLPPDALSEVPPPPNRSGSETMLDLGAQLGMAPESVEDGDDRPTLDEERKLHKETMELPPSPNDEIDLLPFLDEDKGKKRKRKHSLVPIIFQRKKPKDGASADDINRWSTSADAAARTIPIVLAVFVIFGTITAIAMLFSTGGSHSEHIEMRFLSLQGARHRAVRASDTPTRISVETVPEGVFVLFGSEILGKTPIVADLHLELDESVGVEFSGPYFEKWVGEVVRDSTGEYRIFVELKKK